MVARNLFDLREFKKCSNLLKDSIDDPANQSAIFLYYYSLFMAGEIRKEEEIFENGEYFLFLLLILFL
jgi:anaphase-promoting complex subunit 8